MRDVLRIAKPEQRKGENLTCCSGEMKYVSSDLASLVKEKKNCKVSGVGGKLRSLRLLEVIPPQFFFRAMNASSFNGSASGVY